MREQIHSSRTHPPVECVLRRASITGEGPVWCERETRLYWVDVQQPALHCFDAASGEDREWVMPAWIGSFALGGGSMAGHAIVALRTGLHVFEFATGAITPLVPSPYDSRRFLLNEGKCDRAGRFWIGGMYHPLPPIVEGPGVAEQVPLYRLDGRELTPVTSPLSLSNGLAWSPDDRVMYHSDTNQGTVFAWDFDAASGAIENRRVFIKFDEKGPDGAAVDRDGFYWVAMNGGGRLVRCDPVGRIEREIPMPVRYPTMCTFGGPDLNILYVTSATWALSDLEKPRDPLAGSLFALEAPVAGFPTNHWLGAS
ncbi:MAG: SMP-30/gluconolactonase/LRE family protein [Caulobacteraceae bacterium]